MATFTFPIRINVAVGKPVFTDKTGTEVARKIHGRKLEGRLRGGRVEAEDSGAFDASPGGGFNAASLVTPGFSWRTALSLALASDLSYQSEETIKKVAKETWGLRSCEFFSEDDTQCFVASSSEAVLVAFRGTEGNVGDWLGNLNALTTKQPYGYVHRGFFNGFRVVQSQLEAELDRFQGLPVVLTGHSLGGALALIAAAEWADKRNVSRVHTFGQPAVGFKEFREVIDTEYGDVYYRFVNDMDIVPMVPPLYKHSGQLIRFDDDGEVERALGSEELEALGVDIGFLSLDGSPMLTEAQFDELRANILLERARQGGEGMTEATTESAVADVFGGEGVEGFFPSVSDHGLDRYIAKIAAKV